MRNKKGRFVKGHNVTKQMREKISKKRIAYFQNHPKEKEKCKHCLLKYSGYWKNKKRGPLAETWKNNISKSLQGKPGKSWSEETRKKQIKARKGKTPWNKGIKGYASNRKNKPFPQIAGANHYAWKGGKKIDKNGYVLIYKYRHPYAIKNYIREHRFIMEMHIGRYLTPGEVVHHKGILYPINSIKNKQDNRIENLKLFASESEHQKFHAIHSFKRPRHI